MKTYAAYKNSGNVFIGVIPKNWSYIRLKHVSSINKHTLGENTDPDKQIKYIDIGSVSSNGTIGNMKSYLFRDAPSRARRIVSKGNVIVSTVRTYLKAIAQITTDDNDLIASTGFAVLEPDNDLNDSYLSNFARCEYFLQTVVSISKGVSYPATTATDIGNIKVLLPSKEEQQIIGNYLHYKIKAIDNLIDNNQRLIILLEEKKQAMINQAVTKGLNLNVKMKYSGVEWIGKIPEHWALTKLQHLFEVKKIIAKSLGYQILSITQRGIKIKDIQGNEGQISSDYSKYQIVEKGDFAMNHMDLLTGYVDISQYKGVTSPDYRVFELKNKKHNSQFLLNLLQICYRNRLFYAHGRGAAHFGRWRLGINEFNAFVFPIPPALEQQEIVKTIDTISTQSDLLVEKLKKQNFLLEEYRQVLISNVVTGKIDVRDEKIPEKYLAN